MNAMKNMKFTRHSNAVAAGSTTITPSGSIDMSGFDAVTFLVLMGTITTGAATSAEVHCSSDDGDADAFTALEGTKVTIADDQDNKIAIIEVKNPPERYVKCVVNRATQNAVLDGIVAIQHNGAFRPVTQPSSVMAASELHTGPAEGTA